MTQKTKANQGKGAIFDLDGTLLDSMGVWDQVDVDFLAKRGIEVPDDYMQKVAAMQFRQIAEYTIARFGLSDTPEALMEEWDHMARVMYATVVEAKPYARRGSASSRPTAPYSRICSSACARPSPSACGCGPCTMIRPMLIGRRFAVWQMVSCSTSTTRLPYCRNRRRTGIYAFGAFR